jgi:hypothetical protein
MGIRTHVRGPEVAVKLSAPPPPPPEPPEPDQPSDANAPPVSADAPAPTPTPPAEARPLTWPAWFAGADFLLAALAVALAFLVASFAARNSDLWLHLAAGKRLLAGEYRPGTDPFSYSAADRPWVNHSLLFDAGAYLLYSGRGGVLMVVKALAVAVAFGLLIGIRRPGYSLWPWAAVAAVAVVAAAPRMTLSPLVGSVLLLAVTMFLLFRLSHRPGSWRFPVAIGITFWLWANVDGWFFVGPLALALVLVGELLQRGARSSERGTENQGQAEGGLSSVPGSALPAPHSEDGPLGRLPDVRALAVALGVGVLACMLNPHHVRVWELPFELVGGEPGVKADPRLRQALFSPLDSNFFADTAVGRAMGYNANGLAYAVLFVGGGLVLGLAWGTGAGRVRVAHLALWVGFALLSLLSIFAIPLFAVVAVPLIAGQLNALSSHVRLKSWGDPRTRFVLLGSAAGRVLCVVGALAACVLSWPGLLHPPQSNPAYTRRVAWTVEPDGGMVRAAEQLQAWRASGALPAEARGVITSADLANYCAWFAPLEKVYIDTRFNHHREELPGYLAMRAGLALFPLEEPPDPLKLEQDIRKVGAEYVVVTTSPADGSLLQNLARAATTRMWLDADHWSAWYLDGRSGVCGWRARPGEEKPTFAALSVDPVSLAFGPGVVPLPPGTTTPLPPPLGWEAEFLHGPSLPPPGADEALGWQRYREVVRHRRQIVDMLSRFWGLSAPEPAGMTLHRLLYMASRPSTPVGTVADMAVSVPFLAFRSARRAIAADPDHPDGYYALAAALEDPSLPVSSESERTLAMLTAMRQCLVRMPPPERYRPGLYLASPSWVAEQLARLHLGRPDPSGLYTGLAVYAPAFGVLRGTPGVGFEVETNRGPVFFPPFRSSLPKGAQPGWMQLPANQQVQVRSTGKPHLLALDLAREYLVLANKYAAVEFTDTAQAKTRQDELKEELKYVEGILVQETKAYEQDRLRRRKLSEQFEDALRHNLVGEALRILTDKDTNLEHEFGQEAALTALQRISLEMAVGRLEDVAADLELMPAPEGTRPGEDVLRYPYRMLVYQKLVFEGNYAEAGRLMETLEGGVVRLDPNKPSRDKFNPQPYVKLGERYMFCSDLSPLLARALAFTGPLEAVVQAGVPMAALVGSDENPGFLSLQQDLARRRSLQAEFFVNRGLLSLLEGDMPAARLRFESTRLPAVPEWGLPEYRNPQAELYLRLMDQAAKKAAGK